MNRSEARAHSATAVTGLLTFLALVAFAANSLFARLALGQASIDPASYTAVRLLAGAVTLWLFAGSRQTASSVSTDPHWIPAAMLFLYAVAFSFAYVSLTTGTGALILFAAVQITMIAVGLYRGERPSLLHWLGLVMAVGGLIYLVSPGITAPSAAGSLMMSIAGVGWGIYSLLGRRVTQPVHATAGNFIRTVPLALVIFVLCWPSIVITPPGFLWAALSGSLTSALGYVVWYAALPRVTAALAATVQLSVPVLAAIGGVIFLSERMTLRLLLSGALILTGVGLAVMSQKK